jgi:AcrR family transcriptional regulator
VTARRERADRRRGELIDATIASIAQRGLDGCSIHAITQSAGVSRGLIHHYFESKDALLRAAYAALGDQMLQVMRQMADDEALPPIERLEAVIRSAFVPPVSSATNVSAWLGFWHAARTDPRLRAINRRIYADYRALMTRLVGASAQELGADVDVPGVVSALVFLMDGAWIELAIEAESHAPEAAALDYVRLVMGHSLASGLRGG